MTITTNFPNDRSYVEDNELFSVDFDYDAIDKAISSPKPIQVNFELEVSRIVADALQLADSLTDEERKVLIARTFHGKSFRRIGREIGRDKKTVMSRFVDATSKLRNSPLMDSAFQHDECKESA